MRLILPRHRICRTSIRPGTVKNQLFAALDWVPTFVDIAGGPIRGTPNSLIAYWRGNGLRVGETSRSRAETLAPFRSKGTPARGTGMRPPARQKRGAGLGRAIAAATRVRIFEQRDRSADYCCDPFCADQHTSCTSFDRSTTETHEVP